MDNTLGKYEITTHEYVPFWSEAQVQLLTLKKRVAAYLIMININYLSSLKRMVFFKYEILMVHSEYEGLLALVQNRS